MSCLSGSEKVCSMSLIFILQGTQGRSFLQMRLFYLLVCFVFYNVVLILLVGNYIQNIPRFVGGLVIGFINGWQIALLTLPTGPLILSLENP